jgi:phage gpG-like protein
LLHAGASITEALLLKNQYANIHSFFFMNSQNFFNQLLKDVAIELADEYDRNFERQAFFDQPWPARKLNPGDNTLNVHGGAGLRGSIQASHGGGKIIFTSSLPYASIHNQGGTIVVTAAMKKYFWAMHLKASNASNIYTVKSRKKVNNRRTRTLSAAADYYKALALKKVGSTLTIPRRQFIGQHPQATAAIQHCVADAVQRLGEQLKISFKQV